MASTQAISVHSHKGGSGKSLTCINLAAMLVKMGKRVAVIDMDLSAPSLQTYAPKYTGKRINDYLLNEAKPDEFIFDATYILGENLPGKLFLALADITGEAISKINQRDTDSLLNDLFLMMELVRNRLPEDPWNVDYILIDTSPGLTTHAINGVAITDHVIMLLRLVNADVDGTRHFLETLYKSVQPKASLVVNQIADHILQAGGEEKIRNLIATKIVNPIPNGDIKLSGIIPTDKDVISNEFDYALTALYQESGPRPIHVIDEKSQNFAMKFEKIMSGVIDG